MISSSFSPLVRVVAFFEKLSLSRCFGYYHNFKAANRHIRRNAYAAVVFLRLEVDDTDKVNLIQAKNRVSLPTKLSIPRY